MNKQVKLRFYGSLNELLPAAKRDTEFTHIFTQQTAVKDLIESVGIPHTEIDLIIIDNHAVRFSHRVTDGEHIRIYPAAGSTTLAAAANHQPHCQPAVLQTPAFVLDVHLGKLARKLRMLGFDSLYQNNYKDARLAQISATEKRILLSCDRQLLMRNQVRYGYFVRSRQPLQQVLEILSRYQLCDQLKPFSRCMDCNQPIVAVAKQTLEKQLQADTQKYYDEFFQCTHCQKIYWQGSHYLKMKKAIAALCKTNSSL
ncbi:MAG: Mut7-C ubiquitin/RNAse domain-containing protein [Gammaproteobacteria bacterium]|nr:Mut7-C ubiquitin/RNAse domain-containing protein [Gammaproteobacteria bacterium]